MILSSRGSDWIFKQVNKHSFISEMHRFTSQLFSKDRHFSESESVNQPLRLIMMIPAACRHPGTAGRAGPCPCRTHWQPCLNL